MVALFIPRSRTFLEMRVEHIAICEVMGSRPALPDRPKIGRTRTRSSLDDRRAPVAGPNPAQE